MRKGKGLWLGAALAWLAFAFWYTDLGGPLTDAEVASALGVLEARGMVRIPAMMTGRSAEGDRFAHPFLTGVDFLLGPVTFRQG